MAFKKSAISLAREVWPAVLQAMFVLVVVTLPIQKALVVRALSAGSSSFENVAIYPTDVAVALLFIAWLIHGFLNGLPGKLKLFVTGKFGRNKSLLEHCIFILLGGFVLWLLLSVLRAPWLLLGLAQWAHVVLGVTFFVFIRNEWHIVRPFFTPLLVILAVAESALAFTQFVLQHSLGLTALGETVASPAIDGIAKITVGAERVMRPYGTFPHPNVLAIFLAITLFCLLGAYMARRKARWQEEVLFWAAFPIVLCGLLITFSRAVIVLSVLGLGAFLIWEWRRNHQKRAEALARLRPAVIGAFILIVVGAFTAFFFPLVSERAGVTPDSQAVSLRVYYTEVAWSMIKAQPVLGVGAGNFVPVMHTWVGLKPPAWVFQPVHNLYLLIAAESGVPALIFFLGASGCIIGQFWRAKARRGAVFRRALFTAALVFMLAALLDHYAWTTNAGRYLWWLVFGVI